MNKIERKQEHFEVYIDGKFYCSTDSRTEAEREIQEYMSERGVNDESENS